MSSDTAQVLTKAPRRFFPDDLTINGWEDLESYFKDLETRSIEDLDSLKAWLKDLSEVEAVLEEDMAWRYIRTTIDTKDETASASYEFFVKDISPKMSPFFNAFNKKLTESAALDQMDAEKYRIYLRGVRKEIEIFREENVPLFVHVSQLSQQFQSIAGAMTVKYKDEEMTLQKSYSFLKSPDRSEREAVYKLIAARRLENVDELHELYSEMLVKRHQIGLNAGYKNFRDYKFDSLGRFDYTADDCFSFHESIANEIMPIVREFQQERLEALGYGELKPWDAEVDTSGAAPLRPFETGAELLDKSIEVFRRIRPDFGERLETMKAMGHLDLESRIGKAPGGYNYPLYEIGVPFIFMNAVGMQNDVVTMVHEGGHALHSFLTRDLELTSFKSFPSEVAELASMSMELLSMDHWDVFYDDEAELKRAKKDQLKKILGILPWVATIDKYQHWVYENPTHTVEERDEAWLKILNEFSTGIVDHTGFEARRTTMWQGQLHVFEMPFYYIEYGMAQLGAIAVWRNYKENPEKALNDYVAGLSLGYTKSLPEIFEAAGIQFDFSTAYVKQLADFIKEELAKIS
jgi:oligoendopeptidase F